MNAESESERKMRLLEKKVRDLERSLEYNRNGRVSAEHQVEMLQLELKNIIKQNDLILQHENRINELVANFAKWIEQVKK